MKEVYDTLENIDTINGIKYYYFGETYFIINSKESLLNKRKKLYKLLNEINNDVFLSSNQIFAQSKSAIVNIICCQLDNIEHNIDLEKTNKVVKFNFLNLFSRGKNEH